MTTEPLAYFLTFTTYGTWLHGDPRGSVDRSTNAFDSPPQLRNDWLNGKMRRTTTTASVIFSAASRQCVSDAIRQTCFAKGWTLFAVNARTNHVHVVVCSTASPENSMESLKAWSTRRLREAGLVDRGQPVWTRHGSTRRVWTDAELERVCHYVEVSQDDIELHEQRAQEGTGAD